MTSIAIQPIKGNINSEQEEINLNWPERYISIAAGVKLALSGLGNLFSSPFTSILKLGAGGYLLNRGVSGHCAIYSRIGKNTQEPVNINIRSTFTINKPRQEVYNFWRKLDNLPLFMNHLESVELLDNERSHWVLKLPTGVGTVSWDASIVKDKPGEVIGWSSLPNSIIDNAGKVYFRDAADGKGTLVDVIITYQPPAGGVGASIAHILNPFFKNIVDNDVRNFKQYMDIDTSLKPVIAHNGKSHKPTVHKSASN
ncbi:SRPBCC family protein [Mucilaginibacter sp.]|uniref:SRPBCC family protein n=1 Tax=Mucilaginibacter sp. TaxID=1882438 RepID=UPI00261A7094|nr:SRPBCC family protein [Mucilaginibacter sp.]MDB5030977.1 Polyketide cyclase / dehydrase and lipid transport [Mucilaginibacter sp.]